MDAPAPARPDVGQSAVPPRRATSSAGATIAIIVGSIVGAIVILAFIIIVAVAFIGRSASSQFQQIGSCVDRHGNPAICDGFPSP